ncbi:MAG: hypothetical protein HQL46_16150, partial [Gammaproteobacteria bacterium]|nr:hypothetical protein [Gammaproteobacteria bacterium]
MATNNNFFGNNISEEMQQRQAQRVKQSQKLLKKLYHDELNPAYSAPVVKGLKVIVVVSIITIMVFSSLVTLKYNNFIFMQEEVNAKKSMLEAAIQRRHNLFGNLAQLTMNHAVLEDIVFTHVADSRKEFVDKLNLNEEQKNKLLNINDNPAKEISPMEGIVSALSASGQSPLGQMFALAEQFPDIK